MSTSQLSPILVGDSLCGGLHDGVWETDTLVHHFA